MANRRVPTRLLGLALALGLAAGLSACGERDAEPKAAPSTSKAPATPPQAKVPDCVAVWKAGKVFPEDYPGCMANDKLVAAAPIICETGQYIYRYQDHFYATNNAPVRHTKGPLREDPQYKRTYRACTA